MGKKYESIRRFYKSDQWKISRAMKIASTDGLCEVCHKSIGTEVHHKIHLSPENIDDPNITVNPDNLLLLCNECHNRQHERFTSKSEYKFDSDGNLIKK